MDAIYNELYGLAIGKIYKPEQLAYYNKGNQFPKIITTNINGSISSVMLPALSKEQENVERMKQMMRRAIKTSAFILFPMMIGLAAVSEPVVRIILTDKWLPIVPIMQLLCFAYILWPIHTINLQAISAMGKGEIFLKLEIIKKTIGIITLIIGIPFGINALAIMQIIISILSAFINAYPNKRLLEYSLKEQFKDIIPSFILSCAMAKIVYIIVLINFNIILKLIIQILSGGIIYFTMAYVLKIESLSYIIDMIKRKYKGV